MQKNYSFFLAIFLTFAAPVMADGGYSETQRRILTYIESEGYEIADVSRTLFGRYQFISYKFTTRRQTIVHPGTGEILADYRVEDYDRHQAIIKEMEERSNRDDRSDDTVRPSAGNVGEGY